MRECVCVCDKEREKEEEEFNEEHTQSRLTVAGGDKA